MFGDRHGRLAAGFSGRRLKHFLRSFVGDAQQCLERERGVLDAMATARRNLCAFGPCWLFVCALCFARAHPPATSCAEALTALLAAPSGGRVCCDRLPVWPGDEQGACAGRPGSAARS